MATTAVHGPLLAAAMRDPAGAECTPLARGDVEILERLLAASGLATTSLRGRYSVVFVYPGVGAGRDHPELAGCTTEVCTFADETTQFARHGIQLIGLSTQPGDPGGDFLGAVPFPIGRLPEDTESGLLELVERGGRRYALRTSFVVFPDRTGVRIGAIRDSAAHVRRCFDTAMAKRLDTYRRAVLAGLERETRGVRSTLELREFLPNGAASISIAKVELRSELVCKMADPAVVAEEAGYIDRVNRLLAEHGEPPLFPAVVAVSSDERPGWYLMEAADPSPLADRLFDDEAHTTLRGDRLHILMGALARLGRLHEITLRREIPRVSRYHYLERFQAIPARADFRQTFELVFGAAADLETILRTTFVLEDGFVCRPYENQVRFLADHVDELLQPVGAYLHGDVHLPNLLLAPAGGGITFVDPRIVWDGNDVGDPGFGDPMYDYATLLHSLHYMTAILKAIEEDYTAGLLSLGAPPDRSGAPEPGRNGGPLPEDGPVLTVTPGLLRLTAGSTLGWYLEWMETALPVRIRGPNWKARLHVGTANATLGWLKIARCVRTGHAWLAMFVAALYHLELGRRQLEDAGTRPQSGGGP